MRNSTDQKAKDDIPLLDDMVCFALHSASRASVAAYTPVLKRFDLTYLQYLVLLLLWEKDARSVGEIASRLYLDSGTLTPLLKRLERKKYVDRRRAASDERVVLIRLTAGGEAIKSDVVEAVRGLGCRLEGSSIDFELLKESAVALRDLLGNAANNNAKRKVHDSA